MVALPWSQQQLLVLVGLAMTLAAPAPPTTKKIVARSTQSFSPQPLESSNNADSAGPFISAAKLLGTTRLRADVNGKNAAATVTSASNGRNILPRVDGVPPVTRTNDEFLLLELLQPERGLSKSQSFNSLDNFQGQSLGLDTSVRDNFFEVDLQLNTNSQKNTGASLPSSNSVDFNDIFDFSNDLADNAAPLGRPLPSTSLGQSAGNNQQSGSTITVGDLLQNLNGQDGIKVVPLGDLGNTKISTDDIDADLLLALRNAMISGNINDISGIDTGSIGSPLPSSVDQNIDVQGQGVLAAEDSNSPGNQLDLGFDDYGSSAGNFDNSVGTSSVDTAPINEAGSGAINDLISNVDTSTTDPFADDLADPFAIDDDYNADDYDDYSAPDEPPNVFRTKLSDMFFTKGQWIGTLIGGLIDVGSAVGSIFKKGDSNEES